MEVSSCHGKFHRSKHASWHLTGNRRFFPILHTVEIGGWYDMPALRNWILWNAHVIQGGSTMQTEMIFNKVPKYVVDGSQHRWAQLYRLKVKATCRYRSKWTRAPMENSASYFKIAEYSTCLSGSYLMSHVERGRLARCCSNLAQTYGLPSKDSCNSIIASMTMRGQSPISC